MESINRPKLVKEHNLNMVRKALFLARHATRQQLSVMTGISNVTMGSLIQQLLETGEALEKEKIQSSGGRPAAVYSYNACRQFCLLLSVGFEKTEYVFRAVITDLFGEPVWEETRPAVSLDCKATLDYLTRLLRVREPISTIGIGLPGIGFGEYFHRGGGVEYLSLPALEDLQKKCGIPIHVENDVNLAALGYAKSHDLSESETLAYLYLMRGTYGGSAVYIDGKLHLGKGRFAGELLPQPYGSDWFRMVHETSAVLEEALFSTVLPYLTILAPHKMIIASNYIKAEQIENVKHRIDESLGPGHCPDFEITNDFRNEYLNGLKYMALEQMPFPIGSG